jgi:putative hydroxymethylpyrimidine transport system substrate-binding protein
MEVLMTRRFFTLLLAALAFGVAQPAAAQQPEKLTLLLDWFVNPDHAPVIIAKERGLFLKRGLDVQIVVPRR